jgi:iron complex outermembrane receptor protein
MLSPHVSAPLAVAALCSAVVASAATTVTAPAEKRAFNLPRGDAGVTLKQFAATAGTPIVYLVDRVRGATTNAVNGEFTPREALDRMLAGSALEAAQDAATGALVVSRKRTALTQKESEDSDRSRGPPTGLPNPPPSPPTRRSPRCVRVR